MRETLWEWKLDSLADDAEIILAELVSNAIRHGPRSVATGTGELEEGERIVLVRMLGGPSRLLILVWDGAAGTPLIPQAAPGADDENGRGLLLVAALATRWHWYHSQHRHGGKVVWALLEGQDVDRCSCGFLAEETDGLFDHLEETFAAADDRDTDGVAHAEAARDNADPARLYQCLCGYAGDSVGLDAHLLSVFTPADRMGCDGHKHAPAGHDRG